MDNIMFTINIILPLFLLIAIGYFLKTIKVFKEEFLQPATKVSVQVFLPILLFYNIYSSDFSTSFNLPVLTFTIVGVLVLFLFLIIFVPLFVKKNEQRGVIIQALVRSNLLLLGVPICQDMYGIDGAGVAAVICSFAVALFNILSTIALSIFDDRNKSSIKLIFKNIMTTHMLIGALIGILFAVLNIKLPILIEKTIAPISGLATPFALLVLGGSLNFNSLLKNIRILTVSAILKLIIIPAVAVGIALAFGFRKELLAPLVVVFGAPTATASYAMAYQAHADSQLAAQLIAVTNFLSTFSLFFIILFGRNLGFL